MLNIYVTSFKTYLGVSNDLFERIAPKILSMSYQKDMKLQIIQLVKPLINYQNLKEFMTSQQQLNEIKEKYLDSLNRVNLLLLKEHDLRRDQNLYRQQLHKVQLLINKIQKGRDDGLNTIAEDSYLRQIFKQNEKQIKKLERKLNGQQIYNQFKQLKAIQQKYLNMISNDFQNGIQQKLSTIRGKVDQLKKKIKEINKQILSYQQQHLEGIDQYSFSLTILKNYQQQNKQLRQAISKLKQSQKK